MTRDLPKGKNGMRHCQNKLILSRGISPRTQPTKVFLGASNTFLEIGDPGQPAKGVLKPLLVGGSTQPQAPSPCPCPTPTRLERGAGGLYGVWGGQDIKELKKSDLLTLLASAVLWCQPQADKAGGEGKRWGRKPLALSWGQASPAQIPSANCL